MEYSEKKIHIIEAAEKLFATNGFSGTSVRDIAHEAGVNLAMISYYFGSKEKLMQSLFEYRSAAFQLERVLNDEKMTSLEKVNHMIENYMEKVFNQSCFHKIMVREQMRNHDTELGEMLKAFKKKSLLAMQQLIIEGQNKGVFRKDIDLQMLILTMTGTTNQLISTIEFYRYMNEDLKDLSEDDFKATMKNRLFEHLKLLFKAILTHEA
ncbi:TetR family transcriptional regulator [Chitinophagaceae bacterium 26-R-25]|nr:TetR family transcriptional regulator [Chitinophagaceae bacterium 26-R-25]